MSEPLAHKGVNAGVSAANPIKADTRGLEAKLCKNVVSSMDRASFDPRAFAYLLSLVDSRTQGVYMNTFLAYMDTLIHKLETDTYADDIEYGLCIMAMRMRESLDAYR